MATSHQKEDSTSHATCAGVNGQRDCDGSPSGEHRLYDALDCDARLRNGVQDRMATPTSRSLELLRERGYPLVQVVEKWNPFARVRQDLFGIIDIVAVGRKTVGVQTTSYENMFARKRKLSESEALGVLKRAGWRIEVHGWRRPNKKSRRQWTCEILIL